MKWTNESREHYNLKKKAFRYLREVQGCHIVGTEVKLGNRVDVVGAKDIPSKKFEIIGIEVKAHKGDLRGDRKFNNKHFLEKMGMTQEEFRFGFYFDKVYLGVPTSLRGLAWRCVRKTKIGVIDLDKMRVIKPAEKFDNKIDKGDYSNYNRIIAEIARACTRDLEVFLS
jgi:hypothetical protein